MSKQLKNPVWISLVVAAAACQSGQSPAPSDHPDPEATETPLPLSVGPERAAQLVEHAVLAFRAERGALVGGYQLHQASVRDGAIELTPFTFDDRERTARRPMRLETAAITVDGAQLAGELLDSHVDHGVAVLDRGGLVEERLRNDVDGLRQEWHFTEAPPVEGDLAVEVAVGGHAFTTSNASGLHFAAAGGIGFRYSHAIWIGADGAEFPIPAIHDAGIIRMTVPAEVVARTVFPAVLDPTVTPEVGVDIPVPGFTGTNSQNVAIAFDGTNYLVVWDDNRNSQDSDIWGARVSQTGAIIDTLGIQIAAGAGRQSNPTVAFDGTGYVVAWEDFKVAGGTEADIAAATVSTAGAVASLGAVTATTANEVLPQLAAGNGTALVVWTSGAAGATDVRGSLRTTEMFGASIDIAATTAIEVDPAIALDPAGAYLVAWSEGALATADLRGQLVSQAGALSGTAFTISAAAGRQFGGSAAFDGTNYAVVWTVNNAGINLFGARVTTAGVVLDTHTESAMTVGGVVVSGAADNQELPAISCLAGGCLVLWQERRNLATTSFDIYGQLFSPSFTPNGAELIVSNANQGQFSPAVTASGSAFFSAWHDLRDSSANTVFGSTVSAAGAIGAAAPLVGGNNRESLPAVGRAGGNFGVFWSDSRTFGNDIKYVRFNAGGAKLDATALTASSATNAQLSPAATTDLGGNTLVVFSDTRNGLNKDIFATRVSLTTGNLDANGIAVAVAAGDQLVPAVASNGTVALVVWQDRRSGTFDIYGALIDSAGVVTVADIPISTAALDQTRPAVTFDTLSGQFIVVWSDGRSGSPDIYGSRVTAAGAVLDATGVLVSGAAGSQFAPTIASSAAGSFAAWEDRRAGQDIFGTRLTGVGSLQVLDIAGIAISTAAGSQTSPKIASFAGSYTVIWVDNRNTNTDIFGQQLTTGGTLTEAEFGVSTTPDNESNPSFAPGTFNQARVAYESQRLDTSRVQSRLISTTSAPGQICSGPTQCTSGFCIDGFCCDQSCGGNHVPAGPKGSATAGDCHSCANKHTGQGNGTCAPVVAGTVCRDYVSTFCDVQEVCDGVLTTCNALDVGRNAGATCNRTTNFPPGTGMGVCPSALPPGPHRCN